MQMRNTLSRLALLVAVAVLVATASPLLAARQVVDQGGTTVRLPDKVGRLVCLFPQAMSAVFALGLQDVLVGFPNAKLHVEKGRPDGFYARVAPQLLQLPDVGFPGSPNVETIFSLHPDLVIDTDANLHPSPAMQQLRAAGIPVLAVRGGFSGIDDWLAAVRLLGEATGRGERARFYAAFCHEKQRLLENRLANLPEGQRPRVALVSANGNEVVVRGPRTTFAFDLIRRAGGAVMPHAKDGTAGAGGEALFAFDPDVIVLDQNASSARDVSWWHDLRAVKAGRVITPPQEDTNAWHTNYILQLYHPLGLLWLAKELHPDRFRDVDLAAAKRIFDQGVLGLRR